jgi:hypothetical protein
MGLNKGDGGGLFMCESRGREPHEGLLFFLAPAGRRSVSWDTCIHVERLLVFLLFFFSIPVGASYLAFNGDTGISKYGIWSGNPGLQLATVYFVVLRS